MAKSSNGSSPRASQQFKSVSFIVKRMEKLADMYIVTPEPDLVESIEVLQQQAYTVIQQCLSCAQQSNSNKITEQQAQSQKLLVRMGFAA